jgi:DNA-directed RNA polymerase
LLNTCEIDEDGSTVKAFQRETHPNVIRAHPKLLEALIKDESQLQMFIPPISLPMVVPPRKWEAPAWGGYLHNRTLLMRCQDFQVQFPPLKVMFQKYKYLLFFRMHICLVIR